jgi:hypothetical protein
MADSVIEVLDMHETAHTHVQQQIYGDDGSTRGSVGVTAVAAKLVWELMFPSADARPMCIVYCVLVLLDFRKQMYHVGDLGRRKRVRARASAKRWIVCKSSAAELRCSPKVAAGHCL